MLARNNLRTPQPEIVIGLADKPDRLVNSEKARSLVIGQDQNGILLDHLYGANG